MRLFITLFLSELLWETFIRLVRGKGLVCWDPQLGQCPRLRWVAATAHGNGGHTRKELGENVEEGE